MTILSDGAFAYVAGGCAAANQTNNSDCSIVVSYLTRYNFAVDTWQELTPLPRPRCRHGAALVNGKMYMLGGRDAAGAIVSAVVRCVSFNSCSLRFVGVMFSVSAFQFMM